MGEDIGQRIYVKDIKTSEYVNAHEICDWNSSGMLFDAFIPNRNYDVFSLFGSGRGNYDTLNYANYGIPTFLKNTIFERYAIETGNYGFVWFKFPDFKKAIDEYYDELSHPWKNPERYGEYWPDLILTKPKVEITNILEKYKEWLDDNCNILNMLNDFKERFAYFENADDYLKKLIDINETVFLFYFN